MSHTLNSTACIACRADSVSQILNFGPQPPSNRFFSPGTAQLDAHILALGCCQACGLAQLVHPMPTAMVRTRHPWVSYNEPEAHLDAMTDDVIRACRLQSDARIVGFSHQDDTTLQRLNQRGFAQTYRFDSRTDLGVEDSLAGLESLQQALTAGRADRLAGQHGLADLLIVRRVLEHAHAPLEFLRALTLLVKPTGHLVLEVPENTKILTRGDYCFLWEEHITYFTARTLRRLLAQANVGPSLERIYEYPLEDSLVVVARPRSAAATATAAAEEETRLAADFGARFAAMRQRVRGDLSRLQSEGKRVALLGAGHLAIKFLNMFDLKDLLRCVIDDNPRKLGLCLPGTGLPVRPSSELTEDHIDLCLLSVGPESEHRVISTKQAYVDRGGRFASIYASSPLTFWGTAS
jgi:hypothetical protein